MPVLCQTKSTVYHSAPMAGQTAQDSHLATGRKIPYDGSDFFLVILALSCVGTGGNEVH